FLVFIMSYLYSLVLFVLLSFFFFTAPATTEIYTLSLHDALPISRLDGATVGQHWKYRPSSAHFGSLKLNPVGTVWNVWIGGVKSDRKSTRLNSSHVSISYAVFCLKKKKKKIKIQTKKNNNT